MKKITIISAIVIMVLLLGISLASAALCKNSKGYYEDCDKNSYGSSRAKYKTYNVADYDKPIFKGSYGNYRYEMYRNNDYNPNRWFQPSYHRSSGPYFSGGYYYGGYSYYRPYSYGYYSYPSFYSYFWY